MPPTINPATGTVTGPTSPDSGKTAPTGVDPATGFVSGSTSTPRPVRPSLPEPQSE